MNTDDAFDIDVPSAAVQPSRRSLEFHVQENAPHRALLARPTIRSSLLELEWLWYRQEVLQWMNALMDRCSGTFVSFPRLIHYLPLFMCHTTPLQIDLPNTTSPAFFLHPLSSIR